MCLKVQAGAALAYPALYPARISVDERVIGHIARDDGACADKAIPAQGDAANDGSVRANACAALDQGCLIFFLAVDMAARVDDVCQHHGRPKKNIVFHHDPSVKRDIVLNFDVITDDDVSGNKNILADK